MSRLTVYLAIVVLGTSGCVGLMSPLAQTKIHFDESTETLYIENLQLESPIYISTQDGKIVVRRQNGIDAFYEGVKHLTVNFDEPVYIGPVTITGDLYVEAPKVNFTGGLSAANITIHSTGD